MALSRPRKLLYGLVTAVVVLVALEGAVRLTTRQVAAALIPSQEIYDHIKNGSVDFHPDLGWVWTNPPLVEHGLNEHGFRYGDISVEKPPNTYRAFALGDYQTHGAGVPSEESYPGLAETRLRTLAPPGLRVELVNAACPGYSSLQSLRLIRLRLLDYDPDLIVVNCMARDSERDDQAPLRVKWAWLNDLLFHCRLFHALHHGWRTLRADTPVFGPATGTPQEGKRYGNHDLIADLAEEHGFDLIFGNYPTWEKDIDQIKCMTPDSSLPPGVPIARFHETVVGSGLSNSELFFDNNHMKVVGNMCAADALVDAIVEIWMDTGILERDL